MRLLIVDDSIVFRSQIKSAVESSLSFKSIGTAANGKIALQKLQHETYDVITLDMEMPELNGMDTLREIKARGLPVKVVIFASQTLRGGTAAMEALKLGAIEVVAKPDGSAASFDEALKHVKDQLMPILQEVQRSISTTSAPPASKAVATAVSTAASTDPKKVGGRISEADLYKKVMVETFRPKMVVIGSSTGGPNALEVLFQGIKAPTRVPILIVQHMPPVFTASLAHRIGTITGVSAAEAKHGEIITPGKIYVAPGDYHMGVARSPDGVFISLSQSEKRCNVRPSVDVLFDDAAKVLGSQVGAFVLTGMGEDGMAGCKAIKSFAGAVMIQDKESSVVWGMPGAVHAAGAFDKMGSLSECSKVLQAWVMGPI
jgi:two-component system chemotaxis response regulator CheB